MTDLDQKKTGWCDDEDYDSEEGEGEIGLQDSKPSAKEESQAQESEPRESRAAQVDEEGK